MARTYQCWECGRTLGQDDVRRGNVTTLGSSGRRVRTYRRRVNLCQGCFEKHEKHDQRMGALTLAGIVVVAGAFFWLNFVHL